MRWLVRFVVLLLPVLLAAGLPVWTALFAEGPDFPQRLTRDSCNHGSIEGRGVWQQHRYRRGVLGCRATLTFSRDEYGDWRLLELPEEEAEFVRLILGDRWVAPWTPAAVASPGWNSDTTCITMAYGWPRASMAVEYVFDPGSTRIGDPFRLSPVNGVVVGGLEPTELVQGEELERALPTRVVWPGMIANLALYAAVIYGTVSALGFVRWGVCRRRWARGCCGACGYELGAARRCTECGAERPVRARAA